MTPIVNRVLFNILAKDIPTSADFYAQLAGFRTIFANDWYVVMAMPGNEGFELGLIDQVSQFAPRHAWGIHQGSYLTLVVDDVFAAVERARALGVEVIDNPTALENDVTRALIRDPNGVVIDLSTPTAVLEQRSDVRFVPASKDTAIDQQQAEENARHA